MVKEGLQKVQEEYIEHIEDRYSETARETVNTGWEVIDDLTQGGLGGGELGVIVAPAGVGKTSTVPTKSSFSHFISLIL